MKEIMHEYIRRLKCGSLEFPNNIWLAPLAGYSNKALRLFAYRFGAGGAVTEMISTEGLYRLNKRTWQYLDIEDEPFTIVQLFGKNEPDKFYSVSKLLQERCGIKIIDVNFGCPMRKVIRSGAGSFLLKTPAAMADIVKALKDSGIMVSAKIRSGFDSVNLEETVPALRKAGADIIVVHPRLAVQLYNGNADWNEILKARSMTDSLLIASGDIKTPEDAAHVMKLTAADGVMIGRQAVGSTYIFSQILEYFKKGSYSGYAKTDIKNIMIDFARLHIEINKTDNLVPVRSALIQYVKNYENSREIRYLISKITTLTELTEILDKW